MASPDLPITSDRSLGCFSSEESAYVPDATILCPVLVAGSFPGRLQQFIDQPAGDLPRGTAAAQGHQAGPQGQPGPLADAPRALQGRGPALRRRAGGYSPYPARGPRLSD